MATRVVYQGRVLFRSPDWRPFKPMPSERGPDGEPVDTRPVAGDGRPREVGVAYTCPDDGLTYRIVQRLDLSEGWGTAAFWQARYQVPWPTIAGWVERGWFDAAMEAGSPTKRFRCRDERRILAELEINPALLGGARRRRRR